MSSLRGAAEEVVSEVARRLADIAAVRRITETAVDRFPGGREHPVWYAASLNEGALGVALLHAELGDRRSAHAYLSHGTAAAVPEGGGLFNGLGAVVFATRAAARRPGDYASLLGRAEPVVHAAARERAAEETGRVAAGRAGTTFATYDVLQGLTGVGRLLLGAGRAEEVVDCLIALTRDVTVDGARVPGWWVSHAPLADEPAGDGHFNFALAHGIAGPLALLAVAYRDGLRRPGQREAIERIGAWLLGWFHDGSWPRVIGLDQQRRGPGDLARHGSRPDRPSWCYGAPGIARALQLAGAALGEPRWEETAVAAVRHVLAHPWEEWGVIDAGLCHGWAGALHMVRLIAADGDAPDLHDAVDRLARRVVDCFDPEAPFGFRYAAADGAAVAPDRAGLLDGAAGIALALHGYLDSGQSTTGWDAALLLT